MDEEQIPSLQDLGFGPFMTNPLVPQTNQDTSITTDNLIQNLSGAKMNFGSIVSSDGNTVFDITGGVFYVKDPTDATVDKVKLGNLGNNTYGLTVTGGTISGTDITGATITGGVLRTAVSGQRIEIASNQISIFDPSNIERQRIGGSSDAFWDNLGNYAGSLYGFFQGGISVVTTDANYFSCQGDFDCHNAVVVGDLTVYGVKSFRVPHPTKVGKDLQYICPESPEVLTMCRGKSGESQPQHFIDISEPDSIQVITGIEGNWIATGIRKGYKDFNCEPDTKMV